MMGADIGLQVILKMVKAAGCELNMATVPPAEVERCIEAFRAAVAHGGEVSALTGSAPGGDALLGLLVKLPRVPKVTAGQDSET